MRQKDPKSTKPDAAKFALALRRSTVLADRFQIEKLLADSSSFALTYLATDTSADDATHATVAIKEFLPRIFVGRARDGHTVKPHSPADATEFTRALRRFVHEGGILVDTASPHLVRVQQCLETNGTGYLVMDEHQGRPLPTALAEAGGRIPARDAVALILRLLEPIERLQVESVFHRAISPEAVNVTESWQPILHGFSARRHVQGQALELAPGFAAFEQYASNNVGPWTDVYGCAALLYYLVTGVVPPTAIDRVAGKSLPPASAHVPDLSPSLSLAIARGLALLPEQRPHGVAEFRKQIESVSVEPVSVLTASLVVGSALEAQHVAGLSDVETDDPIALELAADGRLVLPRDEQAVVPRFQRLFGKLAERARDSMRSVLPDASRAIEVRSEMADADSIDVRSEIADANPMEVRSEVPNADPVEDRRPTPLAALVEMRSDEAAPTVLEPELVRAPLVRLAQSECPAPRSTAAVPVLDPTELQSQLVALYRSDARRRATRYAIASVLTLAVIGSTYGALANRHTPDVPKPRVATTTARPNAGSQAAVPNKGMSAGVLAVDKNAAQLQGALSDGESAPAKSSDRNSPERAKNDKTTTAPVVSKDSKPTVKTAPTAAVSKPPATQPVAVSKPATTQPVAASKPPATQPVVTSKPPATKSVAASKPAPTPPVSVPAPTKTDKKTVPVDVLSDVEGRLESGNEEAELGLYSLARRIYRAAMVVTDAALEKYSGADTLRTIRAQLNQADQRALRACQAANESFRKQRRPTVRCD